MKPENRERELRRAEDSGEGSRGTDRHDQGCLLSPAEGRVIQSLAEALVTRASVIVRHFDMQVLAGLPNHRRKTMSILDSPTLEIGTNPV